MTNAEAAENLRYLISGDCCESQMDFVEEIEMAIAALQGNTEPAIYDVVEEYPDCTVQVLKNSVTGDYSVGWRRNE